MSKLSKKSDQTYSRIFPMDLSHPFKIVSPKCGPKPLRFKTKEEAKDIFDSLDGQSILTYNRVIEDTCVSKIIGYKPGAFKS